MTLKNIFGGHFHRRHKKREPVSHAQWHSFQTHKSAIFTPSNACDSIEALSLPPTIQSSWIQV